MMEKVRAYYNRHYREEDKRLQYHVFELPMTMYFIRLYLPPGAVLFDTACGTGQYARVLSDEGYVLGLNDVSDVNIQHVKEKFAGQENILFIDRSDIMQSKRWEERKWDAILVLGPMYHLLRRDYRISLLQKAATKLKPGGLIFTSFMTRTAALVYGIKNKPEGILHPEGASRLWESGSDSSFVEATEYFEHAYFSNPAEIEPMLREAGLESLHLAGAEGVFGERFELFHDLSEKLQEAWLDFILHHAEEKEMIYNSKHLLSISRKMV